MSFSNAAVPASSNDFLKSTIARGVPGQVGGATASDEFVDRRRESNSKTGSERRQFGSSHDGLSDAGRELAVAIDQYKLLHHRRYITCDEMLYVITSLGYSK